MLSPFGAFGGHELLFLFFKKYVPWNGIRFIRLVRQYDHVISTPARAPHFCQGRTIEFLSDHNSI